MHNITFNNIKLPGITKSMNLDIGISNSGQKGKSIYGVPEGWCFNIDYITQVGNDYVLNMASSSKTYTIDYSFKSYDDGNPYYSGLRHYTSRNLKFKEMDDLTTELPYDEKLDYRWKLSILDGSNEYVDFYGKLICKDDRFGNNIIYYYDKDLSPEKASLVKIKDSFGQVIEFTFDGIEHKIKMPDKREAIYEFSNKKF